MCYHASRNYTAADLEEYYHLNIEPEVASEFHSFYHENGFDHHPGPVVYRHGDKNELGLFSWGLIPWFTKTQENALMIRNQTMNCISEEMYDKPSFRDSLKGGQRCLIPMTGFFEWRWEDSKGKNKTPHYIFLKDQRIFSVAGIYSSWDDKTDNKKIHSYAVLTTEANEMMAGIHNSKKRMPVIIEKEYEQDWLNPLLTKDDVLALCKPIDTAKMDAYPISKLITSKKDPTNVPEVLQKAETGLLF